MFLFIGRKSFNNVTMMNLQKNRYNRTISKPMKSSVGNVLTLKILMVICEQIKLFFVSRDS